MAYRALERHFQRLGDLQHVAAILQWDEAVMMPPASGERRAQALAALQGMIHEQLTDPRLPALIEQVERGTRPGGALPPLDHAPEPAAARCADAEAGPRTPVERANLREIKRLVRRAQCLPAELVERSARAQLRSEQAWRQKRMDNDFGGFVPLLGEVVALKREMAARLGEALGLAPYDALLDEYEPGCRMEALDRVFAALRGFLPALTGEVLERQARERVRVPEGPFPIDAQRALGASLMCAVGFDPARGRLDVSHHPFCGGVPSDVRITTRYDERNFASALMGVLHETGHAKYEQGLPEAWESQPVGAARGMSAHEGQSLLQEMQVGRSREFLEFLAPQLRAAFPQASSAQPETFSPENLFRLYTRVERGKIRVDADEVTYPCHILVRYEIERQLIAGSMRIDEIPEAWDAGMRALLEISTGDDHRDGCLQDVHWPGGAFGYFPTYTLGAMTAAQLFAAALRAEPRIPEEIARGSFESLNAFLRRAVWSQASLLTTDELMIHASGETLNPGYFEAHLRQRYLR